MQEGWLKIEASDEVSVHIIGNYKKRRSMREQRRRRRSRTSYERSHLHDDACEALMSLREIDRRLIIDAGMTLYSDVKTRPVPSSEGTDERQEQQLPLQTDREWLFNLPSFAYIFLFNFL